MSKIKTTLSTMGYQLGEIIGEKLLEKESFVNAVLCMEKHDYEGIIKAVPRFTSFLCFLIRIFIGSKTMNKTDCLRCFYEYAILFNVKMHGALYHLPFAEIIRSHDGEYRDITNFVEYVTGKEIILMYNPVILKFDKAVCCGLYDIKLDGKYVIIYDDTFKALKENEQIAITLHEVGHIQQLQTGILLSAGPTHKPFHKAHALELAADAYAADILGDHESMRRSLIHLYIRYNWINKLCFRREMFDRIKALEN